MELDELKAGWNVLNERLEQNEILNKRIIKEMIINRTQSAYERLFRFDLFGLILTFAMGVLFPVLVVTGKIVMQPLSFAVLEGAIGIGFIIQVFFSAILLRFNMEKKRICELARLTLIYKLWMKRNFMFASGLVVSVLIAFLFIEKARLVVNWEIRLILMLLFISIMMFYQIRFYLRNIRTIEKGLEELKEFEEEPNQNKSE